jgi:Aminotransferase class I and II
MGDDLANQWGVSLCMPLGRQERMSLPVEHTFVCDRGFSKFRREVSTTLDGQFELIKVLSCGSDAQLFALLRASDGHLPVVLVGCGSYVSGTDSGLENWSTSTFTVHKSVPTSIMWPQDCETQPPKNHTVALPYRILGLDTCTIAKEFENDCFRALHLRCLFARCQGAPIKALLLELVLAGCGATLSDRALQMLAKLAKQHNFVVVVDEIMTGGRTGSMLLLSQKPECFRSVVAFVTMGKWMKCGLVLMSQHEAIRRQSGREIDLTSFRGPSTYQDCYEARLYWRQVMNLQSNASDRRKDILSQLKVDEAEAWGEGCLIFAPISRKDSAQGLKNRFLPMLDGPDRDKFLFDRSGPSWSKSFVNDSVREAATAWLQYKAPYISDTVEGNVLYLILSHIIEICAPSEVKDGEAHDDEDNNADAVIKKNALMDICLASSQSIIDCPALTLKRMLDVAVQKRLLKCVRKSSSRTSTYVINPICTF